jgi:hypothetical protein
MSQTKPKFIKVDVSPGEQQTTPVDPERRLADSEIRIEPCVEQDAKKIVSCRPPENTSPSIPT